MGLPIWGKTEMLHKCQPLNIPVWYCLSHDKYLKVQFTKEKRKMTVTMTVVKLLYHDKGCIKICVRQYCLCSGQEGFELQVMNSQSRKESCNSRKASCNSLSQATSVVIECSAVWSFSAERFFFNVYPRSFDPIYAVTIVCPRSSDPFYVVSNI